MAEYTDRFEDNVPGAFYVDAMCIDCDQCRQTAPEFFTRNESGGYSFVKRQPTTEDEVRLCEEAVDACPIEAIGSDGPSELSPVFERNSMSKVDA